MKRVCQYAGFLAFFLLTACENITNNKCIEGEGAVVSRILEVPSFHGIESLGSFDVEVTYGDHQEVIATGNNNIIELLQTKVKDGIWAVELEEGCYRNFDLVIQITVPQMSLASLLGSGDIIIHNFENQGDLSINLTGSGNFSIGSFSGTENLNLTIGGSGDINMNNNFPDLKTENISILGSGNVMSYPVITPKCNIQILGSGSTYITVTEELTVSIMGSGNVYYKGNPTISSNILGSGSLIHQN